jgi:hypothetical protein
MIIVCLESSSRILLMASPSVSMPGRDCEESIRHGHVVRHVDAEELGVVRRPPRLGKLDDTHVVERALSGIEARVFPERRELPRPKPMCILRLIFWASLKTIL